MISDFVYIQSTYEEALSSSKIAVDQINAALNSGSSVKGLGVSVEIAASFNTALSKVKGLAQRIENIPNLFESWSDKIVQLNLLQMQEADPTGFYYVIKRTADGYYRVFGLGEPMIVNEDGAKYLQEAINKMLLVCPGNYANNGAKVGEKGGPGHVNGQAFDILTNLGMRINYNGGSDTVYYSVNNKKTPISAYEVFNVTYDGNIEDLFNEKVLSTKNAYLKIKPGTNIPYDMKQYVVNGLDNVIEVNNVEYSTPNINNMHYTSLNGQYLDVSKLFATYGWKNVPAYGVKDGTYQNFEWHHFFYDAKEAKNIDVYVKDPDGTEKDFVSEDILFDYELGDSGNEYLEVLKGEEYKPYVEPIVVKPTTPYVPPTSNNPPYSKPSEPITTPPVYTLPENQFSEVMPNITGGSLNFMELNNDFGMYNLSGISESNYNDYINSLIKAGYVLNENGIWVKDIYTIKLERNLNDLLIYLYKKN